MAVSRRRFVAQSLATGLALPVVGGWASPFGFLSVAGAGGALPSWSEDQGTGAFALDREMTALSVDAAVGAAVSDGPAEAGSARSSVRAENIAPFTMIGASIVGGSVADTWVRGRLVGGWSPWLRLPAASGHGPDPGEPDRQASDPVWFGGATGYEIDVRSDATAVRVHLVGPTARQALTMPPAGEAATEGGGYSLPSVRPRSAWGAGPYHGTVELADGLQRAVIHHTVNGNGYSAGQVPSMLRSIQAYHQGSRGWDDIGYNFVLDRFGTVWEARKDSLYEPVIGAHASDHNEGSVGVAYLGDGTSTSLSSSAVASLGKVLGWKLRLHGSRPMPSNIGGHRDVGQTSCPGNAVYAQLGSVRSKAIALQPPAGPFFDVPDTNPQAQFLAWGRTASVIDQLHDGTFHPERTVTRADSVYWLWRFAGRPTGGVPHGFDDIPADAYYRDAVRWARQEGIVKAAPDGRFHPTATTTRERYVLQLWRYAGSPNPSVDHGYTDVPDGVASEVALDWADAYGLVRTTAFGRSANVPRGEGVQMLYRLRRFDDVSARHFAYAAITWARRQVIATGFPLNRFKPAEGVNRGQAVVWLWRMMDRPATPVPPDNPYTDTAGGAWYDAALDWADAAGWVEGLDTSPAEFGPTEVMNRGDAAVWLWRMAGALVSPGDHPFSDVADDDSDLDRSLDWADAFGILTGLGDGTYGPADPITRAQFMRMLNRLANRPGAWDVTPPTTVEF